ncbi:MAG: hypothetical protein ACTSQ3_00080 [Candidatus Heimdallarchaeota archaeon]|nr:hypothetical protein [Candidatus Heimdallarchaeota archaeon]NPE08706.1 hypothetical protein [Asgard group archaeon]
MNKMKKLFKNKRLSAILLFGAMMILWVTTTLTIGPPDEAPPLLDSGP